MRVVFSALLLLFMLTGQAQADAFEDATAGFKAFQAGNLGTAEALISQAIDSGQLDDTSLVEALTLRCSVYVLLTMNDRAISDCARAIQLNASYGPAHLTIAVAYANLGKLPEAISEINKALNSGQLSSTQTAMAYSNRASNLIMLSQFDFAIEDLNKALAINPSDRDAYINRASAYIGIRDFDKALTDIEAALKLDPDSLNALNERGVIWMYRKDYNRAAADFNRAIELVPDDANAYYNRAIIKLIKLDGKSAIAELDRALELSPNAAQFLYLRGIAHRKVKQEKQAKRDIARAKEIDPEVPQKIDEMLRRLQVQ